MDEIRGGAAEWGDRERRRRGYQEDGLGGAGDKVRSVFSRRLGGRLVLLRVSDQSAHGPISVNCRVPGSSRRGRDIGRPPSISLSRHFNPCLALHAVHALSRQSSKCADALFMNLVRWNFDFGLHCECVFVGDYIHIINTYQRQVQLVHAILPSLEPPCPLTLQFPLRSDNSILGSPLTSKSALTQMLLSLLLLVPWLFGVPILM